jgi:lysophospholipase L1-like esterase
MMEKKKITALGDSLTRGVVLNEKNRYSILDNSFIDIIGDTLGLSIANYGKFGCTVDFGEQMVERHADEISSSDYTLLEFGGNDCDFNWGKIADNPADEHFPKTILDSFKEKYGKLIDGVRSLGSRPVIISLPPIDSEYYFSFISRLMNAGQRNNVFNWLGGDINVISRWHEMYNRALFEISGLMQAPIIDITTPFDRHQETMRTLYCADGIHPNAEGHKLIAASIAQKSDILC